MTTAAYIYSLLFFIVRLQTIIKKGDNYATHSGQSRSSHNTDVACQVSSEFLLLSLHLCCCTDCCDLCLAACAVVGCHSQGCHSLGCPALAACWVIVLHLKGLGLLSLALGYLCADQD